MRKPLRVLLQDRSGGEGRAGRANPAPAAAAGGGTPTPATAPSETPSPDKATPGTKKVGVDIVRATGTSHRDLILRLIQQVSEAGPALAHAEGDRNGDLAATLAALEGIAPQNELEGMLAVQMVSTHNAAMACLRRAMIPKQTAEERDLNLKHATKLMSLYVQQVEALDKRRGKGQQKITVEHVNVHAGGQAIVGNVEAPARSAATPSPSIAPKALPYRSNEAMPLIEEREKEKVPRKVPSKSHLE